MAKRVVTVVGMASRNKGISTKNGKAYDMGDVAVTFPNLWDPTKQSVAVATFGGDILDDLGVHVGGNYIASVNSKGQNSFYIDLIGEVE